MMYIKVLEDDRQGFRKLNGLTFLILRLGSLSLEVIIT